MGLANSVLAAAPPRRCERILMSFHPASSTNVIQFPVCSYPAISASPRDIFFSTHDPNLTVSSSSTRNKIPRGGAAG